MNDAVTPERSPVADFAPELALNGEVADGLVICSGTTDGTDHARNSLRRVVVVDDEPSHAEAIRRALSQSNLHQVLICSSLAEYRERCMEWLPHIALVDLNLPDGRALEILNSPPEYGTHPVLIMTSYGNEQTAVEALKAGALDYVVKSPEAFASMGRIVERSLREWRLLQERSQALCALQETSGFYQQILQSADEGIVVLDRQARMQLWNPYMEQLTGLSVGEVLGKDLHEACPQLADGCTQERICLALAGSRPTPLDFPIRQSRSDRQTWLTETMTPIRNTRGEVTGVLVTVRDITWRKEAEEQKRELEEQLRQAQKMEAVGRLAGGVAHDFNNMLSVIIGFAGLSLRRLDPDDPLRRNLLEIEKAAKRSADLTRQLLAFSRKQIITPTLVNLNRVITEHQRLLDRLIGEGVRINFRPGEQLWNVLIDPSQVDQIITNLAVNARDAMEGIGTVTIATDNVTRTEHDRSDLTIPPGEYVRLSFSDTGCGMDGDTLSRIFEPFFTTKESGQGTGLGLSTVYGIVKQGAGEIRVASEPGRGSTFQIYFPRHSSSDESHLIGRETPVQSGLETILLVEDDPQILEMVRLVLGQCGYLVLAASSPEDACTVSASHAGTIHLLLTDVIMPGMNGRQLQVKIKQMRPEIQTLFMSGYTADIITRQGVLDQGVQFIAKPFSLEALAAKVRQVLDA